MILFYLNHTWKEGAFLINYNGDVSDMQELPIGFAVELGKQNVMSLFSSLPKERQDSIVEGARHVDSKNEMSDYVKNSFK